MNVPLRNADWGQRDLSNLPNPWRIPDDEQAIPFPQSLSETPTPWRHSQQRRERPMADPTREEITAVSMIPIIRKMSAVVFVFCCFSFLTYLSTGFIVVHPFVSIFVAVASVIFYMMGGMIGRTSNRMAGGSA
jgi:hypothetical protein